MTNTTIPTLIPTINRLSERLTSIEGFLNRNAASFSKAVTNLQNVGDVVGGLTKSFGKADTLQIRSLAIGSDLNKFLKVNSKTLNDMKGSFFDNAEELLKNFVFGIRDNSEVITGLMTRMKQTGQSTDVLRKFIGDMIPVTGGSMESVDRLVQATEDLSEKYGVTAQSIQEAVIALSPETAFAGLLGIGEEFSHVAATLGGLTKEIGASQLNRTLSFLADSSNFQAKSMLGVGNAMDRLTQQGLTEDEITSRFKDIVDTINMNGDRMFALQNKSIGADIRGIAVTNSGLKDILTNSQQLGVILQKSLEQGNVARSENSDFTKSAKTLNQQAMSYYERALATGGVFDTILTTLPAIQASMVGQGIGGLALGAVGISRSLGTAFNPLTRLLLPVVRFAGPIGLAVGAIATIASFLPEGNDIARKSHKELEDINRKTLEPQKAQPKARNLDDFLIELVNSSIGRSSSKSNGLMDVNETQLKVLEKINDNLEKLNKKQGSGMFSKVGR